MRDKMLESQRIAGEASVGVVAGIELGTYRTKDGVLVHCWYDESGVLMAEREGPRGIERVDPRTIMTAVKLSEDPLWPDRESPVQIGLWND